MIRNASGTDVHHGCDQKRRQEQPVEHCTEPVPDHENQKLMMEQAITGGRQANDYRTRWTQHIAQRHATRQLVANRPHHHDANTGHGGTDRHEHIRMQS